MTEETAAGNKEIFATTRWTVVLEAGQAGSAEAAKALEELCRAYWYPLYAYVRRQGRDSHDAQDLVQEFFARLLERNHIRLADRNRGRFRTFLLTSLQHFLINDWRKANREKRGGGRQVISIDADATEIRFLAEPAEQRSPDKEFERRWAMVLLRRVLHRLQAELVAAEKGRLFAELKGFLIGEKNENSYAAIAARLGMTEGNLKVTVHRLRHRYRELLRLEIAQTVDGAELIDEEIRQLKAVLSG